MARHKRLGEILLEAKVVDEGQLQAALERHWSTGRRLGEVLKDLGMVTERDIAVAVAHQFGFKTVSSDSREPKPPANTITFTVISPRS